MTDSVLGCTYVVPPPPSGQLLNPDNVTQG
jgi:hypothetical protein